MVYTYMCDIRATIQFVDKAMFLTLKMLRIMMS